MAPAHTTADCRSRSYLHALPAQASCSYQRPRVLSPCLLLLSTAGCQNRSCLLFLSKAACPNSPEPAVHIKGHVPLQPCVSYPYPRLTALAAPCLECRAPHRPAR
eukprot:352803-Chlamydomonas_euryale.AAC.11